jgi:hypothetical protein
MNEIAYKISSPRRLHEPNDFRRRNNFTLIRPKIDPNPINESGASEIAMALAMETGIIDAITFKWRLVTAML